MADREIKTRLTVDGVKEATDSIKKLGTEGEAAFKKLQSAADKIAPGLGGKLDKVVGSLKKSFADIGTATGQISKNLAAVQTSATQVGIAFGTVAARIGIAVGAITTAAGAIGTFTKLAADNAEAVSDTAESLGLSAKAYQELAFAAQLSGLAQEDFSAGIGKLNIVIGDALSGNEKAIEKFKQLGIALRDANGQARPTEQILKDLADALARIPDSATRAAVGSDFFGKSVAKWLPFVNQGRTGIEALQKQFAESNLGFSQQDINNAKAFNDALDALYKSVTLLRDKVFLQFAQPFARAFDAINKVIIDNAAQIISVAQNLANQIAPIFQDVVNALLGNDTAVQAQWVITLRDNILAFGDAVYDVVFNVIIPAFNVLSGAASGVAAVINTVFGTDISGPALLLTAALVQLSGAFALLGPAISLVSAAISTLISIFALFGAWPVLIVAGLVAAAVAIYAYWDGIVAYASSAWELLKSGASATWSAIGQAAATVLAGFTQSIANLGTIFITAWTAVVYSASELWNGFGQSFNNLGTMMLTAWNAVTSGINDLWSSTISFIASAAQSAVSWINGVISSIISAINYARTLIGLNGGSGDGYAMGGYVRGRGTSTSDSIPAWLSNGEFVIKAAAVRKYGAAFLSAINGMRLPNGGAPAFSMGGLVNGLSASLMPRFANGGMVTLAGAGGGGRPINVTIGAETFAMTADADVADKLIRYSSKRRVNSAGRKPSWYGA